MNLRIILLAAGLLATACATAQTKLGNNPATLNTDALLELESANKGLLMARVALSSTASPSPLTAHVQGMTVYNTATAGNVAPGFYFNNGTRWVRIANAVSAYTDTSAAVNATPTAAVDGNVIYDQSCSCAKLYTGGVFVQLNDNARARVFADTVAANTAGSSQRVGGNIIFDGSKNGLEIYTGNKWIMPGASPVNYIFADTNAANAFSPSIRIPGQQILDNSCTCLKVYSNGWRLTTGSGQANNSTSFSASTTGTNDLINPSSVTLALGGVYQQVNFGNEVFDNKDSYTSTASDSKFTAPYTGVYHFDVGVLTGVTTAVLGNYNVYLVAGNTIRHTQPLSSVSVGTALNLSTQGEANFGRDIQLNTGDVVRVIVGNTSLATLSITLVAAGTYFDGHLVK